ncbi:DUF4328 domain-containing protein [Dyella sp. GSA-30]|uniref:DUF4328 domain-containing protein n=1 Tax=Dyella sp. GSA-30 TaxID=2994496 RepID=UPI0024935DDC|nr:DUF4328 domain-containing protein [Dyella sp. GSA-30]BDU20348.1 hypothetical protein DYGSA30_18050 [Dyella sp. GSA-30]
MQNVNANAAQEVGRPSWAVGWYFVPLANLVLPALYMSRLWRASIDVHGWAHRSSPILLWAWWPMWVARLLAVYLTFCIYVDATLEQQRLYLQMDTAHGLLCLFALALFLAVVLSVCRAQQRQFGR